MCVIITGTGGMELARENMNQVWVLQLSRYLDKQYLLFFSTCMLNINLVALFLCLYVFCQHFFKPDVEIVW